MADDTDVPGSPDADEPTTVLPPEPAPEPAPAAAPVPAADGPRLRDTVWNFRSMVLVAVGSLIIGGAIGAALVAASNDDDGPDRVRITTFRGDDDGRMPGPMMGGPGQVPGQRGNGNGKGNGNGLGLGHLTEEQRQQLRDFMKQKLQELEEQAPATPTPTPSPAG